MAAALLVIDVQEGMQPFLAHDGKAVVSRIAALIARARKAGVKIVYIQHDGSAESGHPLARSAPGHAIHHQIAPVSGDGIVVKQQCSAFLDTDLDRLLRSSGIDG
ncbi:MAG: isochorismatase family protein [Alphaproteobacteria bacterium]|nr:isochorismatase family protein [Alphaproteobacteria bacterium]